MIQTFHHWGFRHSAGSVDEHSTCIYFMQDPARVIVLMGDRSDGMHFQLRPGLDPPPHTMHAAATQSHQSGSRLSTP